jgi:TolB protein
MNDEDLLRDSLAQIGDQATPVEFLDRSLARSKRIGRNRAMITSTAVVLVLALTGGIAWQVGRPRTNQPSPAVGQSATPSVTPSPSVSSSPSSVTSSPPPAGSVAGLPGWLYYTDGDRLLRLTGSGTQTVLTSGGFTATVSPNGASIAYLDANANVVVADRDGQHHHTVLKGSIGAGWEPAWSPDSRRILTAKNLGGGRVNLGVITLDTATFTPRPHQLNDAIHPLWSADGNHLGYATGTCQLGTADADGANPHLVPVFGELNSSTNPQKRRSCDPTSISPNGRYIAVNQHTGDQPDGDIARNLTANTIIDTRTGATVSLPVPGTITTILFQPNGDILVRTTTKNAHQLTLLNPDHTIKTHLTEPATTANTQLLAYTPE